MNIDEHLFRLTASDFHWASSKADDPDDLCLHGRAEALIGGECIVFDDTNLTAASLMLLRTLHEDHTVVDGDNQLFPHCGHAVFADPENPGRVVIICCPKGVDWNVRHDPDNPDFVVITTHKYCDTFVDRVEYKRQVREFAASVKNFYSNSIVKHDPNDEAQRQGWAAFRQEWNDLYSN
jgi:hypothetical protein